MKFLLICSLASDNESVWKIPINVDFPDKFRSENSPTTPSKWLETKTATMQSVFKPYFLNIKATGYYRVNYDEENWRDLTTTLKKYGDSRLNRLNRAALVDDIMNLARSGKVDYDLALDLLLYLKMENDYIPWEAAFR